MEEESSKQFSCDICKFKANYEYYGSKPSFVKSLVLLEEAYLMRDPFTSDAGLIILGAHCSTCKKCVCLTGECSLFYTKRFCMECVYSNINEFPLEIQEEIRKKQKG
ncbi:hypothetical protein SNE40_015038 [Patella caerulea]|uniref:Cysteine-rich DPF motif domain-containing protein 1 n=1 Tax=Patella caerulea TaxID=87958 RepID=A0AAN8JEU9_PATCE